MYHLFNSCSLLPAPSFLPPPPPCSFDLALTPQVQAVSPTSGSGGTDITVSGAGLADVTVIQFLQVRRQLEACH